MSEIWGTTPEEVVDELRREVQRLRDGLRSLKGEEEVRIGNFETTRVVSYHVLNQKVDAILNPEDGVVVEPVEPVYYPCVCYDDQVCTRPCQ